jgi:hypothetical protein
MTRAVLVHSPEMVAGIWWGAYTVLAGGSAFGVGFAVADRTGFAVGVAASVVITVLAGWWAPPILSRVRQAARVPGRHRPPEQAARQNDSRPL